MLQADGTGRGGGDQILFGDLYSDVEGNNAVGVM